MSSSLPAIYKNPGIYLWVEDVPTKALIEQLWSANTINILVGGDHHTLQGIVEDARRSYGEDGKLIYYLRDLDRKTFTAQSYLSSTGHGYTLPCFEVENLLLDADTLAATPTVNARKLSTKEIDEILITSADALLPLIGLQDVIAQLHPHQFRSPKPKLDDASDLHRAKRWLVAQLQPDAEYWRATALEELRDALNEQTILSRFDDAYNQRKAQLDHGEWRLTFPGKEILKNTIRECQHRQTPLHAAIEDAAKQTAQRATSLAPLPAEALTSPSTIEACLCCLLTLRDQLLTSSH